MNEKKILLFELIKANKQNLIKRVKSYEIKKLIIYSLQFLLNKAIHIEGINDTKRCSKL
jgi:hypothetical protein